MIFEADEDEISPKIPEKTPQKASKKGFYMSIIIDLVRFSIVLCVFLYSYKAAAIILLVLSTGIRKVLIYLAQKMLIKIIRNKINP
jgi:hypothetical protein